MSDVVILTGVSGRLFQRSIGAYQIAWYLRSFGYSVQVIDFVHEMKKAELESIVKNHVSESTLCVGVSTTFLSEQENQFIAAKKQFSMKLPNNVENVLTQIKTEYPQTRIVFGGSRSQSAIFHPLADKVIHGYAEDEFLSYVDSLKYQSSPPNRSPFDISHLDHKFAKEDFIQENETLPLEISRGCIFKCKFCAYPLNGKTKFDYLRPAEKIIDEIKQNYYEYGVSNYFICDDTFNDSTFKLESLANELSKLPFKIKFTAYLRIDLLNAHREQIPMLKEMGLASPFFGIESLNQRSASAIGKGMNVDRVKELLIELHDKHWGPSIPMTCSFIVGLPHETKETITATFEWAKSAPINAVFFPLSLSIETSYKSEFQQNYMSYGYTTLNADLSKWKNQHFTSDIATEMADKFNHELMYQRDLPSSWFLMALLGNGVGLEEAVSTQVKDLNWQKLLRFKRGRVSRYVHDLLTCQTNK